MWRRAHRSSSEWNLRRLSTSIRNRLIDEGDWSYASEWWGSESDGHEVLRSTSDKGNGVVSVVAFPSSRPGKKEWRRTENWLENRYKEMHPTEEEACSRFSVLGYQWRSLRFNDDTRQSTVKVMAASQDSDPGSVFLMQQPHCLAVPYLKSMVSAGLATMASCGYDLEGAVLGKKEMRVLCIGHGGGSLPLFLASKIQGATVSIVEIDPLVIAASVQAMGFPAHSVASTSTQPTRIDEVLWKGSHERICLQESDAENFFQLEASEPLYDLVFVDAYDGEDIFPRALWDPHSPFLASLGARLDPTHGTVVVNLHSDSELLAGRYVSRVGRAYKDVLVGRGNSGFGFTLAVPWICNSTLVVCKGLDGDSERDVIPQTLAAESANVDRILNLPFSSVPYVAHGFVLLD